LKPTGGVGARPSLLWVGNHAHSSSGLGPASHGGMASSGRGTSLLDGGGSGAALGGKKHVDSCPKRIGVSVGSNVGKQAYSSSGLAPSSHGAMVSSGRGASLLDGRGGGAALGGRKHVDSHPKWMGGSVGSKVEMSHLVILGITSCTSLHCTLRCTWFYSTNSM